MDLHDKMWSISDVCPLEWIYINSKDFSQILQDVNRHCKAVSEWMLALTGSQLKLAVMSHFLPLCSRNFRWCRSALDAFEKFLSEITSL